MQKLSEQQIERANAELAAMVDGWILSAEGWRDIAPHLQYAPAPVDGDVIDIMCGTFQIAEGNGVKRMAAAAQVLQSRHEAELSEYKKALLDPSHEEVNIFDLAASPAEHIPVTVIRRGLVAFLAYRRALLEKKPEPEIVVPEGMLDAAWNTTSPFGLKEGIREALANALRWQRDNQA